MKRMQLAVLCLLWVIVTAGLSWAEEIKKIAVLPFTVHSAESIDYVKSGIWDMMISRLSASGEIEVARKDAVEKAVGKIGKSDLTTADVYGLGKTLNVDFVVWGSITKIGNSLSLDGKLLDVAAYSSPVGVFEQCQGMDELIPKISGFAQTITYHLLGKEPPTVSVTAPPPPAVAQTAKPVEKPVRDTMAIDALKTPEGTYTAIINPDFIRDVRPTKRTGFWMSRKHPSQFKGMDIGDVNKDGLNEIVLIDDNSVMIYQKRENRLKLLHKYSGKPYDNFISVDVADVNGNNVKEIIVTNFLRDTVDSFVLEYKEKKYERIASSLPWFLRVIDASGEPVLLGQKLGIDTAFERPIYEIIWKNGEYARGKRMLIPEGLSVYGLTIDAVDGTTQPRIIALDEYDHLKIFKKTKKILSKIEVFGGSRELLYKSPEIFGGSNNYIDFKVQGGERSDQWADEEERTYINVRILTYDINKDGKKEVIIVKNTSPAGRYFKNVRAFTKSEIYDLEWDGFGLAQNWRTRMIQGYVADYQFKDIDNDGQNEIVLAVVLSSTGGIVKKSVVAAYDLKVQ